MISRVGARQVLDRTRLNLTVATVDYTMNQKQQCKKGS